MSLVNINGYTPTLMSGLQLNKANGIDEAKAFPCGPNCTIPIFDSDQDTFYIKTTDAFGNTSSFRIFDGFTERVQLPPLDNRYVTVDQLNSFKEELIGEIRNAKQFVQQPAQSNDAKPFKSNGNSNGSGKANDGASKSGAGSTGRVNETGNVKSGFVSNDQPNQ